MREEGSLYEVVLACCLFFLQLEAEEAFPKTGDWAFEWPQIPR